MLPIKFRVNLTYGLGGDVVWKISRRSPWRPSWISERDDFSNSKSLCHSDASHQVSAQSNLKFKTRCRLKNFKMAAWRPSWISERNHFSNSESLSHSAASHQASAQSNLQFGRRCRLKEFQDGDHLGYRNGTILAIQNLYVAPMPLIKFRLNPTYALGGDVVWRISRWPPWLYLGYWNGMILAILNLHVARMPIIKFGLILT